jgi:hypothetical protein
MFEVKVTMEGNIVRQLLTSISSTYIIFLQEIKIMGFLLHMSRNKHIYSNHVEEKHGVDLMVSPQLVSIVVH